MLRIQTFIVDTLVVLRPLIERVGSHDADIARQLRRASASIAFNVAEGEYSQGRNRVARFYSALGSANETLVGLQVAAALGYIDVLPVDTVERMRKIIGTLVKLVKAKG